MYRHDPKAFAEVCYSMPDGKIWRAVVFKHPDGWELRFGRTVGKADTFLPAGTFHNAKALVKFIDAKVKERLNDSAKPIYNTLHKLKNRSAQSVVPDCFEQAVSAALADEAGKGRGLPECDGCPYRTSCGEPSAQPEIIPIEDVEEPEELFRHRLAQKMKERYGDPKEDVEKAAAKQAISDIFMPWSKDK